MTALADYVDGLVHEPRQVHDGVVDLTVEAVSQVVEPGRIDFGGGELEAAETAAVETEKRSPDDDYGWWNLPGGQYLLSYNETLAPPEGTRLVVRTRSELRRRGAFHPTVHCRDIDAVPLSVPEGGVRIKENARVSTVVGTAER
ncbi:dCTP deaminase [Halobacteriales archaeon QS_1_68_20]|nr:MAG: dCTP deaminase [Halobacteriales archaeon QS_1_68_20]